MKKKTEISPRESYWSHDQTTPGTRVCPRCNGKKTEEQVVFGNRGVVEVPCSACHGYGKVPPPPIRTTW